MSMLLNHLKADVSRVAHHILPLLVGTSVLLVAHQLRPDVAFGQCTTICGDLDNDGALTNDDLWDLLGLMYSSVPSTTFPACADVDDYESVTVRDFVRLAKTVHAGWPAPDCLPQNTALIPPLSQDVEISFPGLLPADAETMTIVLKMRSARTLQALSLPLRIRVDGEIPELAPQNTPDRIVWNSRTTRLASLDGTALFGFANLVVPVPPGTYSLAAFQVNIPSVAWDRPVQIDFVDLSNETNSQLTYGPMAVDADLNTVRPVLTACAVIIAGDVNRDGLWNSVDLIKLVNFVFKAGDEPVPCAAAGDVDCSGTVGSGDLIKLVSYIFRGGVPPCDICPLLTSGDWTCP